MQQMDPLAISFALVERNPTIKPVARPSIGPLILHCRHQFGSASVSTGVKGNATKLGAEDFIALILLDLLLLIVQLIILGKDLSSGSASA
jgi:hypothetical protein